MSRIKKAGFDLISAANSRSVLKRTKMYGPWVLLFTLALGALWRLDPAKTQLYPGCPWLVVTGLYCPGCGGVRALHALVHGRVVEAVGYNAFLPFLFAGITGAVVVGRFRRTRHIAFFILASLFVLAIVFAIARNSGSAPLAFLAP